MPYRRLPNTDTARIKALRTAIEKASNTDYQEIAVTMRTLNDAKSVVAKFERLCNRYQQTYDTQVKANKSFQAKVRNAKMYISHFVQVLYMCVIRSEIKEDHLLLYGLDDMNLLVPDLTSNEQLLEWGRKVIHGENARVSKGGVPIYNPSIAKVNVMYTLFAESYQTQKIHQKATARLQEEVAQYRQIVDKVIFDIWEEVEKYNADFSVETRIDKNREYGIVYYYRKGEMVE